LEIEPGPGVGVQPFELQLRDPDGQTLAQGTIDCRSQVSFRLPLKPDEVGRFILQVVGGDRPCEGDPRILNCAVHRCDWAPAWNEDTDRSSNHDPQSRCQVVEVARTEARDIASADESVRFGRGWQAVDYWGVQPFRWASPCVALVVRAPTGPACALSLELKPGPGVDNRPFRLSVRDKEGQDVASGLVAADGAKCGQGWHGDDRQRVLLRLPLLPGETGRFTLHVDGDPSRSSVSHARSFCAYRCYWVPLAEAAGETLPAFRCEEVCLVLPQDAAPTDGSVKFGRGWHHPEVILGQPLRWAANDATLIVRPRGQAPKRLCLEVKAGPGVLDQPFELQVRNADGRIVARGPVEDNHKHGDNGWSYEKRQLLLLQVPIPPGQEQRLTLHVEGGDYPTPTDLRTLNFCLWRCAWAEPWEPVPENAILSDACRLDAEEVWAPTPEDILPADQGMRLGRGWQAVEQVQGERWRWAASDAELFLEMPLGSPRSLEIELEPRAGFRSRVMNLEVRDGSGSLVASGPVQGRQRVTLALPIAPGRIERYRLHVRGEGRMVNRRPRTQRFRVFRCAWAKETSAAITTDPAVRFSSKTVAAPPSWPPRLLPRALVRVRRVAAQRLPWLRWAYRSCLAAWRRTAAMVSAGQGQLGPSTPVAESAVVAPGPETKPVDLGQLGDFLAPAPQPAPAPVYLHTNACGDFTLMAREHWCDIRGYPELALYSLHIDSLGCYMAHYAGAEEEILAEPMRIYHIEHGRGSGWTPEGASDLFARLAAKGIRVIEYQELCHWTNRMRQQGLPLIFNDLNWGLAAEELPETVITGSAQAIVPIRSTKGSERLSA
jgi:hypothetical protein